jgi:formylglycine-generating enzyme required for sulfatase activity
MTKRYRTIHDSDSRPATVRTRFSASPLPAAAAARRVLGLAAAVVALAFAPAAHAQTACDADTNGDGIVDSADLGALLSEWGLCVNCTADVNGDNLVDSADLGTLLSFWGSTCDILPWATVLEFAPNPAVVTNGSLRKAIAATGLPWRVRDDGTQIEMLLVPPGTFNMGCSASNQFACASDGRESPVHAVTLTDAFYIGRYEVTQAQWTATMGSNPSEYQSASAQVPAAQVPNRPVEKVSWNTVQGFLSATGLRLPTEAEWEYACRAGTTTAFHSMPGLPNGTNDDTQAGNIAWFNSNGGIQTRPVGGKAANALGLHDMSGNVFEWVNDWYFTLYYASSPTVNPLGPTTGSQRVLRGGWFFIDSGGVRSSGRSGATPSTASLNTGFRVARTAAGAPTLASVSPSVGGPSGGTVVTLTGTNLGGATAVTFGGTAATNVAVLSSTTIRVTTPPRAAGTVSVAVTTPGGTETLPNAFTYATSSEWYLVVEQDPDPAIVTDAALRNAIVATGYPWRILDQSTQIEMLLVPPGTFNMGCSASSQYACFSSESPVHAVTLTEAFYIGRYEVTQARWTAVMGSNPSLFTGASVNVPAAQVPNRPVERVSWTMIQDFLSATGLRLPTEAEWEYACRAGTTTAFHSMPGFPNGTNNDAQVGNIAWFTLNELNTTRPVGGKAANALGLHDMSGNVAEWVNDRYSNNYYASSPSTDPPGPATGSARVLRGGSWAGTSDDLRSSNRGSTTPNLAYENLGFRVARTPVAAPTLLSVTPNAGPTTGGTAITLTGTSLASATSVTIGGVPATNLTVVSSTTVTAIVPPGSIGSKNVVVTTAGGTATLTGAYSYVSVPSWATLLEALPAPAVVTDPVLRDAITATGLAWRVRDTATQIELVLVPPGTFNMGCSPLNGGGCPGDELPVHAVTLTNAFYMGRYEVTQAQWTARMGSNPSQFQSASPEVPAAQVPNRPVEKVSWTTAQGFLSATGMRLPTEAEWERAYRAGTTTAFHSMPGFPNGTSDASQVGNIAWFTSNSASQTRPVGGKAANALGLHDMSGNVHEWVSDWYGSTYYASSPPTNPPGPATGSNRITRGGGWDSSASVARCSFRATWPPSYQDGSKGFRVAKTP